MKITDVKVFPVDEDKLKAYATITFENCFIVRDLKVISGNKGYFIAMPSKKRKDGTFRDVAHPLNSETRKMIEDAVLEVYERENVPGSPPPAFQDDQAEDSGSGVMDHEEDPVENHTLEEEVEDTADAEAPAPEAQEGDTEVEDSGPAEADAPEVVEKGAEENPVIEQSDDPEKAFGYEE